MALIKIGFVKDFEVPGTGLVIENCFWALAETVREFNAEAVTDLESPKYIKQVLLAYKDLASFTSTDVNVNKPLRINGGRISVKVEYTVNELNESGMQDKLIQRIQANNEYFADAQVIEIEI
jgi:hypothetical protein